MFSNCDMPEALLLMTEFDKTSIKNHQIKEATVSIHRNLQDLFMQEKWIFMHINF